MSVRSLSAREPSLSALEGTEFTVVYRLILLLEIPGGAVSVARLIGVRDGTALMMELIDDNVASFAFLEPDLESWSPASASAR